MKTLYLCGAGNSDGVRLALRVDEVEKRWDRIVLLDDDPEKLGHRLLDVEVMGPFDRLASADPAHDGVVNLVARTTGGRRRAAERIAGFGVPFVGLVAPGVDTLGATLAADVLVYPHATVGPEVEIGAGSVVFPGAVVGHESTVAPGCVVAANAVLNARVRLGAGVYVGSNATVLPEIAVGEGATVGAGSTVVSDVAAGTTVMGVPARVIVAGPDVKSPTASSALDVDTVEAALVAAWTEVLDGVAVTPSSHVFELGATSLAALRVAERMGREGVALEVVDLFRFPTIRDLARHVAGSATPLGARRVARPMPSHSAAHPASSAGDGVVDPDAESSPESPETEAAGSPTGEALVATITEVFREVLDAPDAGPGSHFFDLGGDPMRAQEACRTLQMITGEPLCFMQVARYPTPFELARHLEATAGQAPTCPAQGVMTRLIHRHEWHRG